MKSFVFLTAILFSAQVFAIHPYYEETCTIATDTNQLSLYKRTYFEGNHFYSLSDIPGLGENPSVYMPGPEVISEDVIDGDEALILSGIKDSYETTEAYDDGCWSGYTKVFNREAVVEKIYPEMALYLGVNTGDVLKYECALEHLEPKGAQCEY